MRKAWLVYQMGAKHPVPVIVYDDLPDKKNFLSPTILQKHDLKDMPRDTDVEILDSFATLTEMFPYSGDAYGKPVKISLDDRKDILTKATNALLAELS